MADPILKNLKNYKFIQQFLLINKKSWKISEAVFLVMFDPSMNELWVT
jgi:hypothetical protein